MAELILTFKFDGTIHKETKGFVGKTCLEKTKFIEEALGTSKNRKLKAEFYDEKEEEQNEEKIRN